MVSTPIWLRGARYPAGICQRIVNHGNNNDLFAGTDYGMFRSSDAGNTWEAVSNGITLQFGSLNVTGFGQGTAFAYSFGDREGQLFRSTDSGLHWMRAGVSGAEVYSFRALAGDSTNWFVNERGQLQFPLIAVGHGKNISEFLFLSLQFKDEQYTLGQKMELSFQSTPAILEIHQQRPP